MTCVWRSVAELSPRRLTFYPSNPCEIRGDQSVIWTGFSPCTSVSPISIIPPVLNTHSFIYHRRCTMFFSQYVSLPCLYNFTKAPYSFIYHRRCVMFFSQYFSLPCQYYSTNAPYSFIHLPPTVYNAFRPVLHFSHVCIILPILHTHSFIYHRRCIMFFSQYFSFPCQYHCINAPHSFIHLPPTLYNVFLPVLQFLLSVSFHKCSTFIHLSTTDAV
jgi:hypothetical protein